MSDLSFLDSKATTLPQNNSSTIIEDKPINELKSIIEDKAIKEVKSNGN